MSLPHAGTILGSLMCLLYGRLVVVGGVAREPILIDACFGPGALTDAARPLRRVDLHHSVSRRVVAGSRRRGGLARSY
eukprot:scaffold87868_cov89-Phaeocystis_antarctica.AAC.4